MKTLKSIDAKKLVKVLLGTFIFCLSLQVLYSFAPTIVHCGATDLIDLGQDAAEEIKNDTYNLAIAIVPVALIVLALGIFFTHNEKKIAGYISFAITCILAFVFIIWIYNGNLVTTLERWFAK